MSSSASSLVSIVIHHWMCMPCPFRLLCQNVVTKILCKANTQYLNKRVKKNLVSTQTNSPEEQPGWQWQSRRVEYDVRAIEMPSANIHPCRSCVFPKHQRWNLVVSPSPHLLLKVPKFRIHIVCYSKRKLKVSTMSRKEAFAAHMKIFGATTTGGHTARFDTANYFRWTIEIDVALPVSIRVNAATVKPMPLNPIDQILQIRIIPITLDHNHQLLFSFVLHLNFNEKSFSHEGWINSRTFSR